MGTRLMKGRTGLITALLIGGTIGSQAAPTAVPVPVGSAASKVTDTLAYTTDRLASGETGAPTVQVTLNGGTPATFLLDTGTSECAVTETMAAKLGLSPQTTTQSAQPFIMAGSKAEAVPLTIQLGRFRFPNFPTVVIKESRFKQVLGHPLDGIVGMNLLSHFALILEPQSHVLMLQTPGKLSAEDVRSLGFKRAGTLPLTRAANGTYWAPVGLANGIRTSQENLMIDTGALTSILSYPVAHALGLIPSRTDITISFGNGVFVGDLARVPTVTLGSQTGPGSNPGSALTLHGGDFLYPNSPEAFGASPHALGLNILGVCSVLLDFPGQTLTLQPLQIAK